MTPETLIALGYFASVLMGLSLGLIGGGGSILTVPILVYLFGLSPSTATGYSLFIVGLTALVGSVSYIRQGSIDFKTGLTFAIPSFIGVFASRAYLLPNLPESILTFGSFTLTKDLLIMLVFAALMLAASTTMIRKKKPKAAIQISDSARLSLIAAEGLIIGGITGFVGAGGGFLIIPALVILAGLSMHKAVGTSLMIIAIKSLFGFLGDFKSAQVIDWTLLFSLSLIAVVGIIIGSILSKKIPEAKLKAAFGWFVLIMGSIILLEQLS